MVVERRVFVRSWSMKPRSWWRTFLEEPRASSRSDGKEIRRPRHPHAQRAAQGRGRRAYAAKYNTPGSLQYVKDFRTKKRRDTTTELVPGRRAGRWPAGPAGSLHETSTDEPSVDRPARRPARLGDLHGRPALREDDERECLRERAAGGVGHGDEEDRVHLDLGLPISLPFVRQVEIVRQGVVL